MNDVESSPTALEYERELLTLLPPAQDKSEDARKWIEYPYKKRSWRQALLEPIVLRESCMLLACDIRAGDAKKRYVAMGFDEFWMSYKRTCKRAADAMQTIDLLHDSASDVGEQISLSPESIAALKQAKEDANKAAYYEMTVPGRPCHLPFDIEYYRNAHNQRPFEELVDMFLTLLSRLLHEYYSIPDARWHWQEVWTDSSNDEKISRHLIIKLPCQLMMVDMLHCGALTRRLACLAIRDYGEPKDNPLFVSGADASRMDYEPNNDTKIPFWDPLIYTRWRVLRMVGSSKSGKFRFFMPFFYSVSTASQTSACSSSEEITQLEHQIDKLDIEHTTTTRVGRRGTVDDITREFFMSSLVHAPCARPHETRLLHAREPDERECFSTTLIPTHRGGRYVLQTHMVGHAGSIPQSRSRTAVALQNSLALSTNVWSNDHMFASSTSATHDDGGDWIKCSWRDRDSCASTNESTNPIVRLLLDACDTLVCSLQLESKPGGDSGGGSSSSSPMAQYYWMNSSARIAIVQVKHHYCPLSDVVHHSNHMSYMLELQPRTQLIPRYRARCYKCRTTRHNYQPLAFWDGEWKQRLENIDMLVEKQYMRLAFKLFGFLASTLWPSTNTAGDNSDDEEEGEEE